MRYYSAINLKLTPNIVRNKWYRDFALRAGSQNDVTDKHLIIIKQPERFQKLSGPAIQWLSWLETSQQLIDQTQ